MQREDVGDLFGPFLARIRPARILEIGTSSGGFTMILHDLCEELELHIPIWTLEIVDQPWFTRLRDVGIRTISENLFSPDYLSLARPELVVPFIQSPGISVVLCDGGSKKDEFRLLKPFLKPGDYIAAHDYAPNKEIYEKQFKDKIWNWMEIQDSDIDMTDLEDLPEFNEVAWKMARNLR